MERPSHISFASHSSLSRTPWIGLAIAFQLAGAWLFMHGLSTGTVKIDGIIDVLPFTDTPMTPMPPPPPPPSTTIEIPTVDMPTFTTETAEPGNRITTTVTAPTQQTASLLPPVSSPVERAAASIAGTHTTPPYPPVARRQGLEGVVTLRLTVGTDGRVSAAEIVTSAGSTELDQVARDWILGHWRYRPALKDGNPATAQVLASVTYSLKNQ